MSFQQTKRRDQRIDRLAHRSPGSSQAPIVQSGFDRDSNRPCLKNSKLQQFRLNRLKLLIGGDACVWRPFNWRMPNERLGCGVSTSR
jgi:hypothetical protein